MTIEPVTTEPTSPQTWQWRAAGAWPGGTVVGVAAARGPHGKTRLLAATRAGLICSDDGGLSWHEDWAVMADPGVVAVAYAGTAEEDWPAAFAATETGRLYRSGDGGVAWAEVTSWAGLGVAAVLCASSAFADDGILFVGTSEGIFRSLDGGASWESCNFGLIDADVLCLACAPDFAASQLVWAGTAGGGLYRSRNQGRAWREAGIGLPDAPVQALAVSPNFVEDRTLYAGLEAQGVYRSTDGGESWSLYGAALAGQSINALACLGEGQGLAAATDRGLFVADASAGQWEEAAGSHPGVLALAAGPDCVAAGAYWDGALLAAADGRAWRQTATPPLHVPPLVAVSDVGWIALDMNGALAASMDGGVTWQPLAPPEVEGLFAVAAQPGEGAASIWAATGDGLWSLDLTQGQWTQGQWQKVDAPGLSAGPLLAVEVAHGGAARLAYTAEGRLYAGDGGATWQEITGPWQGQSLLRALPAQDAAGEAAALALTIQAKEPQAQAQGPYAVDVWLRRAGAWANVAGLETDIPSMLALWPGADDLWLAAQHRLITLRWDRRAQAWNASQRFFAPDEPITALTASMDGSLWAATTRALYCSADQGVIWRRAADLPERRPVVYVRAAATRLDVVTLGGRVWRGEITPV
ncbi:MAG: hypothetical protein IT329_18540 [Caldilineaceae bacterium]|nr:hypothetical protein [Caldilineaceae bacterium]